MKIIKQGRLPNQREHRATCQSCKCEFVFEEKEAEYVSDMRDGDCFKVKCPQKGCNQHIFIQTAR